jgi:hypothetical protein
MMDRKRKGKDGQEWDGVTCEEASAITMKDGWMK